MSDVTNKDFRLKGVNQATSFVREDAYLVDIVELVGGSAGTHELVAIPAGNAVVGAKLVGEVALAGGTSIQLGLKVGTASAVAFGGTVTSLGKGAVKCISADGEVAYSEDPQALCLTIDGTMTAGTFVLVVETVPVVDFLTRG